MNLTPNLNSSDSTVQQISKQLCTQIEQAIALSGGKITFADFMHRCLYTPGLGYYSNGSHKLGEGGDFVTAPELSPLFSRTIAQQALPVLKQLSEPNLLEFGAGSGKMAATILAELEHANLLPNNYFILETSAELRLRQQETLLATVPELINRVHWLDQLPAQFTGLILANEVCDAMPVHRLLFKDNEVYELYVSFEKGTFQWCNGPLSDPALKERASHIKDLIGEHAMAYEAEVNLAAEAWTSSIASFLKQGAVFIIDYGHPRTPYYHPQRSNGSLMCHYQHQGHDNPFVHIGLQDITAHVEYTSLAEAAVAGGLQVAGFLSQADFLLSGGITTLAAAEMNTNDLNMMQCASEIKRLTLPGEMGEVFKVLVLTTGLEQPLTNIQAGDRRYSL
ncbi:MAG: SAM-dependent methyltransferase [Tenericutes bacterium]|nr:MAG: SAM-dependent methyltransferase [Mycoplasmatota bacterium]